MATMRPLPHAAQFGSESPHHSVEHVTERLRAKSLGPLPLRAGDPPRLLRIKDAERYDARVQGACSIHRVAEAAGVSNRVLGRGDERDGARMRTGHRAVDVGEAILLPPLVVSVGVVVELLRHAARARSRGVSWWRIRQWVCERAPDEGAAVAALDRIDRWQGGGR